MGKELVGCLTLNLSGTQLADTSRGRRVETEWELPWGQIRSRRSKRAAGRVDLNRRGRPRDSVLCGAAEPPGGSRGRPGMPAEPAHAQNPSSEPLWVSEVIG